MESQAVLVVAFNLSLTISFEAGSGPLKAPAPPVAAISL